MTGASGFIGSHVVRALLSDEREVKALVLEGSDRENLNGLDIEIVTGDVRDRAAVRAALSGCDIVYHLAAYYQFWARDPQLIYDVNVRGTRIVLEEAMRRGVSRVVHTSSVAAFGLPNDGHPGNEEIPYNFTQRIGHYKRSKYLAQRQALKMFEHGLPVVVVNPTTPIGAGDRAPTPTGQIVLHFLNGLMKAYPDMGVNIVDVEDVARGHLLAAKRGRLGECYILGGEDMHFRDLLRVLEEITGFVAPRIRMPFPLTLGMAYLSEFISNAITRRPPLVSMESARMSRFYYFFDSTKARTELGFSRSDPRRTLQKSVDWFMTNGYVKPQRRRQYIDRKGGFRV